MKKLATILVVFITILSMAVMPAAQACSRLVYDSDNGPVTARSMDWFHNPEAKLWFFEKGMERKGGAGEQSLEWTSKYDSIVTSSYDIATVDGINEEGLVVNLLFLLETSYGQPTESDKTLSIGAWGQYVLDNYATVDDAVKGLGQDPQPFKITTVTLNQLATSLRPGSIPDDILSIEVLPGVTMGNLPFSLHMSISDKTGNSAIVEYIKGEPIIHSKKEYDVLTNDPIFDQQLAINSYWKTLYSSLNENNIAGLFLPGTSSASDRFIRASYYLGAMESNAEEYKEDRRSELAAALGIIRNVSDPLGLDGQDLGTTQWRTLANQRNNVCKITNDTDATYFFEYTKNPNIFWASMKKLKDKNLSSMVFDQTTAPYLSGDVSGNFQAKAPFCWDLLSPTCDNDD
ncbi:linear amide C-N hydrolase [Okeania sp. SIO3I5]|uniref:linear amide C-N hydrolase n=1 Tax=Okeania sp. SIO3I5 TaxID=2607805 RepID=UPI0025EB66F0|nr:linear amide C-N hydrolase [Okeania sp. SIO3I5]